MSGRLAGTSSSERTLDERDLSSLRPARENAPRPRKPTVLREVTNGIVCFCGERFGESQALEFMLHLRAEVGEELAVLERRRAKDRFANMPPERAERRRERNRAGNMTPEQLARKRARERERRRKPEVLARIREYERKRSQDPEYRAAERERARARAQHPEARERHNAQQREYRARQEAEREAAS